MNSHTDIDSDETSGYLCRINEENFKMMFQSSELITDFNNKTRRVRLQLYFL